MKKLLAVGMLLTVAVAHGENDIVSDGIKPGDSSSRWVLGGSVGVISNPLRGEDSEGFLNPNIEYRGKHFFLDEGKFGVTLWRAAQFSGGLVLDSKASFLYEDEEYDDNVVLKGLKERDDTLNAGVYIKHRSSLGLLTATVFDEISGEHEGQYADVNYVFDYQLGQWSLNPVVGVSWSSADEVDHFYGVSQQESRSFRKAYKGKAATSLYAGLRSRFKINEHVDLDLKAMYAKLGAGISDSSIVEDNHIAFTSIGMNYNF